MKLFLSYQLEYLCSSLESVGEKNAHHAKNQIKPKLEYDLSLMIASIICFHVLCSFKWKFAPALIIIGKKREKKKEGKKNQQKIPQTQTSCGKWIRWADRRMCMDVTGGYSKDGGSSSAISPQLCIGEDSWASRKSCFPGTLRKNPSDKRTYRNSETASFLCLYGACWQELACLSSSWVVIK